MKSIEKEKKKMAAFPPPSAAFSLSHKAGGFWQSCAAFAYVITVASVIAPALSEA